MASLSTTSKRSWLVDQLFMGKPAREYLKSLLTPFNLIAAAILAVGIPVLVYRFAVGLGAATNLNADYPWGLWIGLDVASGVALAAGGYTMAAAVYIFGLEEYRPIVRPAVLTGFLGYFFVVIGLMADLGRPWNLPVPVFFSHGVTSVLFEVAWCVMLYLIVLFLEFVPAALEWLGWKRARSLAVKMTMALVIFGLVLSTLHQSSLGSLFLMAKGKLHPLWYSTNLPIYFFVSSIAAGASMVIVEASISHRVFQDQHDPSKPVHLDKLVLGLAKTASLILFTYFFGKILGMIESGTFSLLWTGWGAWFSVELLGFVLLPCVMFAYGARHAKVGLVRAAAWITVVGIALNRFNVTFLAYKWNADVRYVPHWMEIVVSATFIVMLVIVFRWIVNRMPVLRPHPQYANSH